MLKLLVILISLFYISNCQIRNPIPKQLHECNIDELSLINDLFQEVRREGVLRYYSMGHARHFSGAHNNPYNFFTFHGQMIRDLEEIFRRKDPRVQEIPVWNMTVVPAVPNYFYAITSGWNEIRRIRPPNVLIPQPLVRALRNIRYNVPYLQLINYCTNIHNDIHNWYGGTFGSPASPADPMFWFFHKYWDEIYIQWTRVNRVNVLPPTMAIPPHPSIR